MGTVLVLRTCKADGTSFGGFQWPKEGAVSAPDWQSSKQCGNGLHGLLWGVGGQDGSPGAGYLDWSSESLWQVVAVEENEIVDLGDKVKFPRCEVVHTGNQISATDYLLANGAAGKAVHGATVKAGDGGTATAGVRGTATAGYGGTATAGDGGTATAGVRGTATAGDGGTATAGDGGTATAGVGGTATAGYGGTFAIQWRDAARRKYRWALAEVGEKGILPNTKYRLTSKGKFVLAEQTP